MTKKWEIVPGSDLSDRSKWRPLGGDRYAAIRARILIVESDGENSLPGPVIEELNVGPHVAHEIKIKRQITNIRTDTISNAIKFATSSRVCDRLAAKLGAEFSAKIPGFSGKIDSEILSKTDYEIASTTESVLTGTSSHTFEETQEDEHVLKLNPTTKRGVVQIRRRYRPRTWEVYLHSYEYLEISYRRGVLWGDIRKTIKKTDSGVLGHPLVSVVFYVPQSKADGFDCPVPHELSSPDNIEILPLMKPMPRSIAPATEEDLESLAKLAFPATRMEKKAVKSKMTGRREGMSGIGGGPTAARKAVRRGVTKKAMRKGVPKKKATTKHLVRKTVKVKALRRATARKTSRRAGARRGHR
ncbi:hypothetical protein V3H18_04280 [Methylocystis sp. 9N]|uniref:Uncharacterized protein n=1 Tax=Methylocystis borbori TaxID=3118750 RepID=A0ABU7XEF3_9HYPH